jgi:hypothetical protein
MPYGFSEICVSRVHETGERQMSRQSEQLERGTAQTRAHLAETLDELRLRLTPGRVVDQLIDYAREPPMANYLRTLTREIQENPLPLLLIGIGIAWMVIGSNRRSQERAVREMAKEIASVEPASPAGPIRVGRLIQPKTRSFAPVGG